MLNKLMKLHKNEKGITGLETAIILIAFVVVASVFAYTVLSAGLFSTQKSQEAVYSGLSEAQSTLQLSGGVIAYSDTAGSNSQDALATFTAGSVAAIQFMVSLSSPTGEPIDLTPTDSLALGALAGFDDSSSPTQISYSDIANNIASCDWTVDWIGTNNGNDLLEGNEKARITVYLHQLGGTDANEYDDGANPPFLADDSLDAYAKFTLEVKASKGAVLNISRSLPAIINDVNDLH